MGSVPTVLECKTVPTVTKYEFVIAINIPEMNEDNIMNFSELHFVECLIKIIEMVKLGCVARRVFDHRTQVMWDM